MGWLLRISFDQRFGFDDQDELHSTLWDLGTTGIAEAPKPTLPTLAPPETDSNPRPDGSEPGGLIAGFETEADARQALSILEGHGHLTVTVVPVDPDVWSSTTAETEIVLGTLPFTMEVGAAFGHGQHPTTLLANTLLARELDQQGQGSSLLDFGTGTGFLALSSLAAGATTVVAIDSDPVARAIAGRNIERAVAALELGADVTTTVISALPGSHATVFDVVVANVLLVVHRQLAAQLAAAVVPGGALIVSGILREQRNAAIDLYAGFSIDDEIYNDDWLALHLRAMVT